MSPQLSGVAKFNAQLARHFEVPCLGLPDAIRQIRKGDRVLLSVKLTDMSAADAAIVEEFHEVVRQRGATFDLFFHTYDRLPLEQTLLADAGTIFCGNAEIHAALTATGKPLSLVWCPALVDPDASVKRSDLTIFSFGMAHKIQLAYYQLLHTRLEELDRPYSIWISTAFHEKSGFGELDEAVLELRSIFGARVQFLGFLSDDALNYFVDQVQLFVAFFAKGLRANNTSAYVPMERGCAILTNLDRFSPAWLRHGVNVLDIHKLAVESLRPESLGRLAAVAQLDVRRHAGWPQLVSLMNEHYGG
jgi:hypothetical protein